MFVKKALFKRLLKNTWKTCGLRISASKNFYFLSGTWWAVYVNKRYMPKEIKAGIIELIGEMPEDGQTFLCDASGNQIEEYVQKKITMESFQRNLIETPLIISGNGKRTIRIYQDPEDGDIVLVNEYIREMLDNKEIESEAGEDPIEPPKYTKDHAICFYNNTMILTADLIVKEENKLKFLDEMKEVGINLIEDET